MKRNVFRISYSFNIIIILITNNNEIKQNKNNSILNNNNNINTRIKKIITKSIIRI